MASAISRPMSLALDLVRVLAALAVVIGHSVQIGLYRGAWPFSEVIQHSAVIVFFVLSGLVIAESRARGPSLRDYAVARVSRIMPVALAGIVLGTLVWQIGLALNLNLHQPEGFDRQDLRAMLMPFLFLSAREFGAGPVANPPYWSLCYEVWYYALFAAATYGARQRRIFLVALFALLAGPGVIVLMPIWLAGVWLRSRLPGLQLTPVRGLIWILAGSVIVQLAGGHALALRDLSEAWVPLDAGTLRFAQLWLADWLMTPGVVAIFLGLAPLAQAAEGSLERLSGAIRRAAGSSFTLYIVHWPLISLAVALGISTRSPLGFAGFVLLVVAGSTALATLLEHKATPALRRRLAARSGARLQAA